ncbi:MAG TPA: flavin reductase family protein [Steroidobacteraceae bacterium]|nr:flavin reductase family protein [Steroidobacteraceae bacterium]
MFIRFDAAAESQKAAVLSPFKACVVPRPIGWISTVDAHGRPNLAPFSFFNAISESPPMVMFCANGEHIEGGEKDSVRNARSTGEFVVNLATFELREAVNASSAEVAHGVNEFELADLATAPSILVSAPRVARSPVSLECRVTGILELPGEAGGEIGRMVMGRVLGIHIDESAIVDGRVASARLRPIARLGYREYAVIESTFKMTRPGGS